GLAGGRPTGLSRRGRAELAAARRARGVAGHHGRRHPGAGFFEPGARPRAAAGSTPGRVIANRGLAGIDGTTSVAGGIALAHTRERARTGRDSRDDPTASGQDSRPPSSGQRTAGRVRALMGDLTALHDLTGLII